MRILFVVQLHRFSTTCKQHIKAETLSIPNSKVMKCKHKSIMKQQAEDESTLKSTGYETWFSLLQL